MHVMRQQACAWHRTLEHELDFAAGHLHGQGLYMSPLRGPDSTFEALVQSSLAPGGFDGGAALSQVVKMGKEGQGQEGAGLQQLLLKEALFADRWPLHVLSGQNLLPMYAV